MLYYLPYIVIPILLFSATFMVGRKVIIAGPKLANTSLHDYINLFVFMAFLIATVTFLKDLPAVIDTYFKVFNVLPSVPESNNENFDTKTMVEGKDVKFEIGVKDFRNIEDYKNDVDISGYPIGSYHIEDINNGEQIITSLFSSINKFIIDNNHRELSVSVDIIGQADAIPSKLNNYSGDLGDLRGILYHSLNTGKNLTRDLLSNETKLTNEDFALLRAIDILIVMNRSIRFDSVNYKIHTKVSKFTGNNERKAIIRVSIKNALQKNYDSLNEVQKFLFNLKT